MRARTKCNLRMIFIVLSLLAMNSCGGGQEPTDKQEPLNQEKSTPPPATSFPSLFGPTLKAPFFPPMGPTFQPPPKKPQPTPSPTPRSTSQPTPPPNPPPANTANLIVYTRNIILDNFLGGPSLQNGGPFIETLNPDTKTSKILVQDAKAVSLMPSWNQDKTKVVFASNRDGDATKDLDLWVVNADGSGLAPLTNNPGHDWTPAWSPDGKWIAFASTRRAAPNQYNEVYAFDIFLFNVTTGEQTLLADLGRQDEDPLFSKDNQKVYFVGEVIEQDQSVFKIFEVNIAAHTPPRDLGIKGEDISIDYNKNILYYYNQASLYSFDLNTPQSKKLTADGQNIPYEPWVNSNGNPLQVVYINNLGANGGNIVISNLDGSNASTVGLMPDAFFPRW